MSSEKKFSAREAAVAVLKKAEELLKSWSMNKATSHAYLGNRDTQTGHEKGVNTRAYLSNVRPNEGVSHAGDWLRTSGSGKKAAKDIAHRKLEELKAMPKPNLPKSEEMAKAKVDEGKSLNEKQQARAHRSFSQNVGVHKPHDKSTPGESTMGVNARLAAQKPAGSTNRKFHEDAAKRAVSYVSSDSKKIQPSLPKSEEMAKEEKGVHPVASVSRKVDDGWKDAGRSPAGQAARRHSSGRGTDKSLNAAKVSHKRVLEEIRAMPKPNLTKADEAKTGAQHAAEADKRRAEIARREIAENKGPRAGDLGASLKRQAKQNLTKDEQMPKEQVQGEPVDVKERVEDQVAPENNPKEKAEGNNPEWGNEPGHYKLAKFCGHISAKRKMRSQPSDENMEKSQKARDWARNESSKEKGVHTPAKMEAPVYHQEGASRAGLDAKWGNKFPQRNESAKAAHKEKLGELKDMPKPNLPKSEKV